jgi:hypothetical protein
VKSQRWISALWFVAAALALSAAAVKYFRSGEIPWEITAAGVFLLAMGFGMRTRPRDEAPARVPPPDA